jgi:hypothetical protein
LVGRLLLLRYALYYYLFICLLAFLFFYGGRHENIAVALLSSGPFPRNKYCGNVRETADMKKRS